MSHTASWPTPVLSCQSRKSAQRFSDGQPTTIPASIISSELTPLSSESASIPTSTKRESWNGIKSTSQWVATLLNSHRRSSNNPPPHLHQPPPFLQTPLQPLLPHP